jgi:23S rRNA (guanine745-N1)-methyltransferase
VAREGYVNLLLGGRARARGDSAEMVRARRRFLASGAYDPLSSAVATAVAASGVGTAASVVLDVGCGEGHHTRRLVAPTIIGVDVAKPAVMAAAHAHPQGWYAVANATALPLPDGSIDAVVNIFGPVFARELARVVRPGGAVVMAHPGPHHLAALRALVYESPRPHQVKPPLRGAADWFEEVGSVPVRFPVEVEGPGAAADLFAMTPYRWHGPRDIGERLAEAGRQRLTTEVDARVTTYRRKPGPPGV